MKFIEFIAKGIGKVWSFCATLIILSITILSVLFIITAFVPDSILRAMEIFKSVIG